MQLRYSIVITRSLPDARLTSGIVLYLLLVLCLPRLPMLMDAPVNLPVPLAAPASHARIVTRLTPEALTLPADPSLRFSDTCATAAPPSDYAYHVPGDYA